MEKLKIRVNSEAESKEAQELFFELGYEKGVCSTGGYPALIIATPESRFQKTPYSSRATSLNHEAHSQYKEINLPELRDLVVLKRNSIDDATHIDKIGEPWLVFGNNEFYSWADNGWMQESENVVLNYNPKPIEKPMKEYLRKNSNGTYSYIGMVRPEHVSDFMIEIPEGADFVTEHTTGTIHFWRKGSYKTDGSNHDWIDMTCHNEKYDAAYWCEISPSNIIWQRPSRPEELPFIDDEPSQSLNDQYAEIEKVRQTLNQRQEQYGSFEDVAMITEQMVDVMRKGYYENLAYNQKMALYMICSKMARIVNGNPNHKDSWHDIAGYATLIDNELESEKDMPF